MNTSLTPEANNENYLLPHIDDGQGELSLRELKFVDNALAELKDANPGAI